MAISFNTPNFKSNFNNVSFGSNVVKGINSAIQPLASDTFSKSAKVAAAVTTPIAALNIPKSDSFTTKMVSLRENPKIKEKIYITRNNKPFVDGANFYQYDKNSKLIGKMNVDADVANDCLGAPKFYKDKGFSYIDFLQTANVGRGKSPYKGLGTEMLKSAVEYSKEKGHDGRIGLLALNQTGVSPTPFYFKNGLRFSGEDMNKLMQDYLAGKTDVFPDSGFMYLPEENIEKLLASIS